MRNYLTKAATEILVLSLIVSHLGYCNLIVYGIAEIELTKIQRIQNMCAKLVLSRDKYDSAKQALFDLHWLLLSENVNRRQELRSASDPGIRYDIPFNKKTFIDRSLCTIGPKLWNNLPLYIKQLVSIDVFKKNLITHYFRQFYGLF